MMDWIGQNKQWLFSGVGVVIIGGIMSFFKWGLGKGGPAPSNTNSVNIVNNVGVHGDASQPSSAEIGRTEEQIRRIKDATRILFVDDDERFKVVKILRNSGWTNTSLVKDVSSLNERVVAEADILFVDIQGVGVRLGFKDEGLGLAAALKEKYPDKKLVIYSAEPRGERFHRALRKADESLEKNADPYEFQQLVERFAGIA